MERTRYFAVEPAHCLTCSKGIEGQTEGKSPLFSYDEHQLHDETAIGALFKPLKLLAIFQVSTVSTPLDPKMLKAEFRDDQKYRRCGT
jgi:hypothetical protein